MDIPTETYTFKIRDSKRPYQVIAIDKDRKRICYLGLKWEFTKAMIGDYKYINDQGEVVMEYGEDDFKN